MQHVFFAFVIIFRFPTILLYLFMILPLVFFYCLRQLQLFIVLVNIFCSSLKFFFQNDKVMTDNQTVLLFSVEDINVQTFQLSNNALLRMFHFKHAIFHVTKKITKGCWDSVNNHYCSISLRFSWDCYVIQCYNEQLKIVIKLFSCKNSRKNFEQYVIFLIGNWCIDLSRACNGTFVK